ncbi:MAG TPA: carboxypeptidase-like regulatory domain-containing protein, partial [Saprospiraceae bacterium]|nr:carboxypeptidase-like regulatory domain-containing protein [Saprospiraceae bacterium]
MKHTRLTLTFLLFAAVLRLVAQTATVSGQITSFPDGAGVPNYPVWIFGNDPASGVSVLTDANGYYSAQINNAPEGSLLEVSTIDSCNQTSLAQLVPVVNGAASADFQLCQDNPWPDTTCMAFIG